MKNDFWIKNISDKNVTLSDLALIVPTQKSMNLLDKKRHSYTLEQLEKSVSSGSIYKKRDRIKVRNTIPDPKENKIEKLVSDQCRITIPRSMVVIEEIRYDELDISDDQYAEEFADIAKI